MKFAEPTTIVSLGAAAPEVCPEPLDSGSLPPPQAVRARPKPASIATPRAIREVRIGDDPPVRSRRVRGVGVFEGDNTQPARAGCGTQAR